MLERHVTDEALLLLASGKLSSAATKITTRHLKHCLHCQRRYEEARQVRAVWAGLSQEGIAGFFRKLPEIGIRSEKDTFRFPVAPISAIVAASAVLICFLFLPNAVPSAHASILLDYAIRKQSEYGMPAALRFGSEGVDCAIQRGDGQVLSLANSSSCSEVMNQIRKSPWGHGNPLSANTFRQWRSSLKDKRDTVKRESGSWQIETTTYSGPLRTASLTLRASDYRPTQLELRYDDLQEITIAEYAGDTELAAVPAPSAPSAVPRLPKDVDSIADLQEVRAWETLQELKADSGWEATVVREGAKVVVKASIATDSRKQEIEDAFRNIAGVEVDLDDIRKQGSPSFLPKRAFSQGDGPPLAKAWLDQQFPESGAQGAYINRTLELSQAVLGRAFFLDELKQRHRALSGCTCAATLSRMIARDEMQLVVAQEALRSEILPLAGSVLPSASKPLTYQAAEKMDLAIQSLLTTNDLQTNSSLEQEISIVRRLL